jgi:dTDP-4-dehydrorhamnose 3,5-epimerase
MYIPSGLAHGFYTFEDHTLFLNKTTTVFQQDADTGIRWDSCGIDWPDTSPILSEKDRIAQTLDQFHSPFKL